MRAFLLALSFFAVTAQAETLDLAKFRQKSMTEIQRVVGQANVLEEGQTVFRDGAGAVDLEPLFDYAAYYYVVPVIAGVLPSDDLQLAYRLGLNGSEDFVMVKHAADGQALEVSFPESGIVVLKQGTRQKSVDDLLHRLRKQAPGGKFTFLKNLAMITYKVEILEVAPVIALLHSAKIVKDIGIDYEVYRTPFNFDLPTMVADPGVIDPDKYRTVTKQLREQGLKFASETTVPEGLR